MSTGYIRSFNATLLRRVKEKRRFIQVLAGPRQVGKTTAIRQVMEALELPSHYASADQPTLRDEIWLEAQWERARLSARQKSPALLVIDEIQKIPRWAEAVKRLWDEDTFASTELHVILLGSSALLMQAGLTESLAGRFEIIRAGHWSYRECRDFFGWDVNTFIYHGGYPGAAPLIGDRERWVRYILDSLIETTLSRDLLMLTRVDKPALLRRLFHLGCEYSGQIVSYHKMLGQLHDAGNTTTLAHYLQLLSGAGFITGLGKFSGHTLRMRSSSPKLLVYNTALMTAHSYKDFAAAREDHEFWGRLVESAIGAYLLNLALDGRLELSYWREGNKEVDYVALVRGEIAALEVKSGRLRDSLGGMRAFEKAFSPTRKMLVGTGGIPIEEFLQWEP